MGTGSVTVAGGCRCGACRYTLALDALPPVYCCHCRDCQTWSGSAFAMQGVVRADAIVATGPVVEYAFTNPSRSISTQYVCGICHTRLWNLNSAREGLAVVRAGTLDASDMLVPRLHMWARRKQPWFVIGQDMPTYDERPPVADFIAIMMRPQGV